jgi:hypothetical protein
MAITNLKRIPLELAVWVAFNEYDFLPEVNTVSATGLLKPIRQIILPKRLTGTNTIILDVENLIPSALGSAIHSAIQRAWENGNHKKALKELGFPDDVSNRILVNPTPEELAAVPRAIPVYVEIRSSRTINVMGVDFLVSGKFDMVCDGRITDTKSTTVFSWTKGNKWEDYRNQMSIYRWLNPDKVTRDVGRINFIFTDWAKLDARRNPAYPQSRFESKELPLMTLEETEAWIRNKISLLLMYQDLPEHELPRCTDEDLWLTPSVYKYYKKESTSESGGRSTRNFDSMADAQAYMNENGGIGIIKEKKGTPKRCGYCPAFKICTQKEEYNHD